MKDKIVMEGIRDRTIAFTGGILGWSGAIFAKVTSVEAAGIFAGYSAGIASLATAIYFIAKTFRGR